MFSIHAVSGEIVTSGRVSFGFSSSAIGLVVLAEDQGPNSEPSSTSVTIRAAEINRHAPEITFAENSDPRRLSITENSPAGSFVGHVIVRDPDVGLAGKVECIVSGGDGPSYAAAYDNFRLVPLFTSEYQLVTGRSFDREVRERYDFAIQCRDLGRPSMTSSLSVSVNIVDVDDNKPTFPVEEYRFTVAENNERGQLIGRVVATDSDLVSSFPLVVSDWRNYLFFGRSRRRRGGLVLDRCDIRCHIRQGALRP
jgi:hypothetical protein